MASTLYTTLTHELGAAVYCVDPSAKIVKFGDIYPYVKSKKVIPVNSSLAEMGLEYFEERKLNPDEVLNKKILDDAKKSADAMVKVMGSPKKVYWTGPTNDKSKFGSADVVLFTAKGVFPTSLKFGSGQLKNTTLKNLSATVFGNFKVDDQTVESAIMSKKEWAVLTQFWISCIRDIVKQEYDVKVQKAWEDEVKGVTDFDIWLKTKLKHADVWKSIGIDKKWLRELGRKIFEASPDKSAKEKWLNFRKKTLDQQLLYNTFNNFLTNFGDEIKKNLKQFFYFQMSSNPVTDIWYCAEGGKKLWAIPSQKTFETQLKNISFDSAISVDKNGTLKYLFKVEKAADPVIVISISVRWKSGQMSTPLEVTSNLDKFDKSFFNDILLKQVKTNETKVHSLAKSKVMNEYFDLLSGKML